MGIWFSTESIETVESSAFPFLGGRCFIFVWTKLALQPRVFLAGGNTAADMAFRFVFVQNLLYLTVKDWVHML